jgi:hypothetical protein
MPTILLWTDGLENPVIEEIGAGDRALHETGSGARRSCGTPPIVAAAPGFGRERGFGQVRRAVA